MSDNCCNTKNNCGFLKNIFCGNNCMFIIVFIIIILLLLNNCNKCNNSCNSNSCNDDII